jgi:hypothetical protein
VSCLGHRDAHAGLRQGRRGRSWPAHTAQRRRNRHYRCRALRANHRVTKVPHTVRDHVESTTVVSASPADPPAASSAGTVPPLLPVPLASGPCLSARAGESLSRPRAGPRWRVGPVQWPLFVFFEIPVSSLFHRFD